MIRMQCPFVVYEFIANHESYSVSGNESKGEGGFCFRRPQQSEQKFYAPVTAILRKMEDYLQKYG